MTLDIEIKLTNDYTEDDADKILSFLRQGLAEKFNEFYGRQITTELMTELTDSVRNYLKDNISGDYCIISGDHYPGSSIVTINIAPQHQQIINFYPEVVADD